MKRLRLSHYLCETPRRKAFAHITFLHRIDGMRFLTAHRQEELPQPPYVRSRGRPRLKSNLRIMGTDVFCKLSDRKPQEFALRTIEHTIDQLQQPSQTIQDDNSSVSFSLSNSSCGHCTYIGSRLAYFPEVQWWNRGIVRFTKRNMIVKLENSVLIRIPLNTVVELIYYPSGSLTLTLSTVPLFFSDVSPAETLAAQLQNTNLNQHGNAASLNITERKRICCLEGRHSEVVGQCLVYQFNVSPVDFPAKINDLKEKCELTITRYDFAIPGTVPSVALGQFTASLAILRRQLADYTQSNALPFGILFQLHALATNAYLHPSTVFALAKELHRSFIMRKMTGMRPISVEAMKKLFGQIDWPSPYTDPMDFQVGSLLSALEENEKQVQEGLDQRYGLFAPSENLARVHRVTVTPSRMTLHGPEMEPYNRILRRFRNHHDYFVRVQFCDENGQDLFFNSRVSYDDVFARFKKVLKRGIQIAGRTFTFLGFSHSSLRSQSAWFSAPFFDDDGNFQTYFSITKAIGDFSKIKSPARCAARIGQAFSETPYAVPLGENGIRVEDIPDVQSPDGSRVFSDGVGTISVDVVKSIWRYIPVKKSAPTSFQFRMGGSKGMLSADSRLPGSVIKIRPSMRKFESVGMKELEICDMASKPVPLVLNRRIIKILEDMGVPDEWFFKLQSAELARIRAVTANTQNTANFLKGQSVGDSIGLYKLFSNSSLMNIDYKKEPFLRSIVEAVVLRELRLLKHKARIPVRHGMTLYGIMDETGYLEENEVYVTYSTMDGQHVPPPGPGRLLVTRSPALHDGDIQFAYNVLPPSDHPLRIHRNCIVFSQKGRRDLPSQLSGGDLDGDLYNIAWDREAQPVQTFEPADYPRVEPVDIGRVVQVDDMADFFVDFMRTNHLGIIATRHMILADQMELGTHDPNCKKLAQLHSTAVDFSKSGIAVKMGELPRANNYRPDFLAPGPQAHIVDRSEIDLDQYVVQSNEDPDEDIGPRRKYYRSEKILGKLYRAVDERQIWYNDIHSKVTYGKGTFWSDFVTACTIRCASHGLFPRWKARQEEAERIRYAYEDAIFSAMNDFSDHPTHAITELEVFIGHIISETGVQTRRQRDRSIRLKDEIERITAWITLQMRPHGDNTDAPLTGYETEIDAVELCLACVCVGCEVWRMLNRRMMHYRLLSFRVVAACALLDELELFERGKKGGGGFVGVSR